MQISSDFMQFQKMIEEAFRHSVIIYSAQFFDPNPEELVTSIAFLDEKNPSGIYIIEPFPTEQEFLALYPEAIRVTTVSP